MNTEKIMPVMTKAGEIWGRDAILLEKVNIVNEMTFELVGTFNGSACSGLSNRLFSYNIVFESVLIFKMTQLDFNEIPYVSSFDFIENSDFIAQLIAQDKSEFIGKIDESYQHFVFRTYDTIFEIIGKDFNLKLT